MSTRPRRPEYDPTHVRRGRQEPRRVHLVGRGQAARRLQAVRVRARDPAARRAAAARLRARADEGRGARAGRRAEGQGRERRSGAERRHGAPRDLQHVEARLQAAARRPDARRREPARLHRRLLARGARRDRRSSASRRRSRGSTRRTCSTSCSASSPRSTSIPTTVSNMEMGYLYEELIRRFSELSNETAGEHFTPREVIRLMVNLLFVEDEDTLRTPGIVKTLYDPACGTGGMLSVAEDYLRELNPDARLEVFGQELNAETYAICRSDMMLKGQDASHIALGNSFSEDGHAGRTFDYLLANPPFGVEWKQVEKDVRGRARDARLRRPLRRRAAADQRRQLPLPPAHALEDEAAPSRAARASRSSSTARRSSPAPPARASPRSAAGSSRTTGSRPSSRCPTSSSTTPASRPTSGSSPTARPRAARQGAARRRPRARG